MCIHNLKDLRIGSILFTRDPGVISSSICYILKSPFSHVAVYIGNGQVIEAGWTGISIAPFCKYLDGSYTIEVLNLPLSDKQTEEFIKVLKERLNDSYDYSQLFGLFLDVVFSKRIFSKLLNHPSEWICSEYVAFALKSIGYKLVKEPEVSNPKMLYSELKSYSCSRTEPGL